MPAGKGRRGEPAVAEAQPASHGRGGQLQGPDRDRSDGTLRKLMDVSRLAAMGWQARTPFDVALQETYRWYLENEASHRS